MGPAVLPPLMATLNDLSWERVRGTAVHGSTPFDMRLLTEVMSGLWLGAHPRVIPEDAKAILSLYPVNYEPSTADSRRGLIPIRRVNLADSLEVPSPELLDDLAQWVTDRLIEGGPVLVHCQMGLNRSALVVGLVMVRQGWSPEDAINHLRLKRSPAVLCNPAFAQWLLDREPS